MVNISKRPVDVKKLFKLYQLFFEVVSKAKNKDEFLELIKDLLSPVEQIMVAKRIAIIYLLTKNVDQLAIARYIKVSRATVSKFNLLFFEKKTRLIKIIESMIKKEKIGHFLEDLFADLFIQPGIKIGHWQRYWDHKRRQNERKMIDV
jgi:Trp operon repressor